MINGARTPSCAWMLISTLLMSSVACAQLASLPAPRLLSLMPMGGQAGTTVEVTLTGTDLDEANALRFSVPSITAKPKLDAKGQPEMFKFIVTLPADAPRGIHEVRAVTRFGISTARAFVVGGLPEVVRAKPCNTPVTALPLEIGTVCNSSVTVAAADHYSFQAKKGQRVLVDCAAPEIDSKLLKVIIITDAQGRDLLVNRRGGLVDFTAPAEGRYMIKVHSLTYEGGAEHFYRLTLTDAGHTEFLFPPMTGNGFSVFGRMTGGTPDPKTVLDGKPLEVKAMKMEMESNAPLATTAQGLPLPLAAVSSPTFSFSSSEAKSLPQHITLLRGSGATMLEKEPNSGGADSQKITLPCDIAGQSYPAADVDSYEFTAKKGEVWWIEVTSHRLGLPTDPFVVVQRLAAEGKLTDVVEINDIANPIAGTPYDAGSSDPLGKLEIKEDGIHRLQLRDLFGSTRTDPRHVYRLQIRKAAPDFALVAWPFHAPTVNNDRSAPAKPLALWKAGTMALQVAAIRRDGFDGEINLRADDLPAGVTAQGSKVPAGKTQGFVFLTAAETAQAAEVYLRIFGRATVDGKTVEHPVRLASVIWPVGDMNTEIPRARLAAENVISISGREMRPISIAPAESKVYEGRAGETLTIPLKITWRGEPTSAIKLKAIGTGFETIKEVDVALKAATANVTIDLAALKTAPGEYVFALNGVGKGKYTRNPADTKSAPKDYAEIIVSEPIRITVRAADKK